VPHAKRAAATRSPEKPWGFEEYHAGEEEEEGSEEFVWCNEEELKSKMEGILPIAYPNFRLQYINYNNTTIYYKYYYTETEIQI